MTCKVVFGHASSCCYRLQKLSDFFFGEMAPGAFGQIPKLDIGDPHPFQGGDAITGLLDHTANLSVSAFLELDEKTVAGNPFDNGGPGFFSQNGHALFHLCEGAFGYWGCNGHDVFLFVIKRRVQQVVVEVSVIGHEQETGGILVKTPHRVNPFRDIHQVHNDFFIFLVAGSDI